MMTLISNTPKEQARTMDVEPHSLVNFGISEERILKELFDRFDTITVKKLPVILNIFKASRIEGCKLVRQQDLPFDLERGSCNTFRQPTEQVLLCFHFQRSSGARICHT